MKWYLLIGVFAGILVVGLLPAQCPLVEKPVAYSPTIVPSEFVDVIDNPWMPLIPGTTHAYEGETDSGFERVEVYVTHETREILGVTCTVVRDTVWVDSELVEDTYDWFAQHMSGDVWYFGEEVKDYENGVLVGSVGAWVAGVDGALPGIIMKADPLVGAVYRQERYAGEAEDMAEILALDAKVSAPYGDYSDCLQAKEWTPLEPRALEHKFYARGIGMVSEVVVRDGWGRAAPCRCEDEGQHGASRRGLTPSTDGLSRNWALVRSRKQHSDSAYPFRAAERCIFRRGLNRPSLSLLSFLMLSLVRWAGDTSYSALRSEASDRGGGARGRKIPGYHLPE